MDVSENVRWRTQFFLNEVCMISSVKIIEWSIVVNKCTTTLSFYIFEYGAEYGAECTVEYGAKIYFI